MSGDLGDVLAAVVAGVRDSQQQLDEAARDSLDAFGATGVPPTAFAWSSVGVTAPIALNVRPGATRVGDGGGPGRLTVRVAFVPAVQGGDDPGPVRP